MMRETLISFGVPEWQTDGLIEDYAHYRRGEASTIASGVKDAKAKCHAHLMIFSAIMRLLFLSNS
jgi:hypothetical protein